MPPEQRRWGKAGVRLTPEEAAANDRRHALERQHNAEAEARSLAAARRKWAAGMVVPRHITTALDARKLYGPEVDRACGVEEPAVDMWEAGKLYPTWEQLCALAELTGKTPEWFTTRHGILTPAHTTLRFHRPNECLDPEPQILQYPDEVVRRCPGTGLP